MAHQIVERQRLEPRARGGGRARGSTSTTTSAAASAARRSGLRRPRVAVSRGGGFSELLLLALGQRGVAPRRLRLQLDARRAQRLALRSHLRRRRLPRLPPLVGRRARLLLAARAVSTAAICAARSASRCARACATSANASARCRAASSTRRFRSRPSSSAAARFRTTSTSRFSSRGFAARAYISAPSSAVANEPIDSRWPSTVMSTRYGRASVTLGSTASPFVASYPVTYVTPLKPVDVRSDLASVRPSAAAAAYTSDFVIGRAGSHSHEAPSLAFCSAADSVGVGALCQCAAEGHLPPSGVGRPPRSSTASRGAPVAAGAGAASGAPAPAGGTTSSAATTTTASASAVASAAAASATTATSSSAITTSGSASSTCAAGSAAAASS